MPCYDAYLVRIWRGESEDGVQWAGRLEHLPDGRRRHFGTLEELLAELRQLLALEGIEPATTEPNAAADPTPE